MNVRGILEELPGKVLGGHEGLEASVTGAYVGDLLSCVMAKARAGNIWVTIQSHPNIVAVAVVTGLAGIIVADDTPLDPVTLDRASAERVPIVSTPLDSFSVAGALWEMGIRGAR